MAGGRSQFWGPEAQRRDASMVGFWWGPFPVHAPSRCILTSRFSPGAGLRGPSSCHRVVRQGVNMNFRGTQTFTLSQCSSRRAHTFRVSWSSYKHFNSHSSSRRPPQAVIQVAAWSSHDFTCLPPAWLLGGSRRATFSTRGATRQHPQGALLQRADVETLESGTGGSEGSGGRTGRGCPLGGVLPSRVGGDSPG